MSSTGGGLIVAMAFAGASSPVGRQSWRRAWYCGVSATICLLVVLGGRVWSQPPKDLQDTGNCSLDPSQNRTFSSGGKNYTALSLFEPGDTIAVDRITDDDVTELAKEVARLKANKCYEVCVRSLATGKAVEQAVQNCEMVFILAHGSKDPPYISMGGRPQVDLKQFPQSVSAGSVWMASCFGQQTVEKLNGTSGSRYKTLPKDQFDADGKVGLHKMVQGLIAELKKLQDTQCDKPKRICILSGVQKVVGK